MVVREIDTGVDATKRIAGQSTTDETIFRAITCFIASTKEGVPPYHRLL